MVPPLSAKSPVKPPVKPPVKQPLSAKRIPSALTKSLLPPLGVGLLASAGIHGSLFAVLPLLPSLSVASEPEMKRDVQLEELSAADLSRLPDFAIADSLPPPQFSGVELDDFDNSEDLFNLLPEGDSADSIVSSPFSTPLLSRTTTSTRSLPYTTDWFSFPQTYTPPPPESATTDIVPPPETTDPPPEQRLPGELPENQSTEVSTDAQDLTGEDNPTAPPTEDQPRGGPVPTDDPVTQFRNAQRVQHRFNSSIAIGEEQALKELDGLDGSVRGVERMELDYGSRSRYCLTPRPEEATVLEEDLLVSVAVEVNLDGEILGIKPLQTSGYNILNQEASQEVRTWVETEAQSWAAKESQEIESEGIPISPDSPLIQTFRMEFQYNGEVCQGIPGDVPTG